MVTTTYRQDCGTHVGLLLHAAVGEAPCGECLEGDLLRRLAVEAAPHRVASPRPAVRLAPVTPEKAAEHRAQLLAALDAADRRRRGVSGGSQSRAAS